MIVSESPCALRIRRDDLARARPCRSARRGLPLVMLTALTALGCAGSPREAAVRVESWGTMREVMRDGRSEGRVALAGLAARGAIGVGALAGLAGEVTIVDGRVLVAAVEGTECRVNEAAASDEAALLARAEVTRWEQSPLPACPDLAALEAAIAEALAAQGFDPRTPTPVRVRGRAPHAAIHVVAGSCPLANPGGPPPWRFTGALEQVELIGFFVEGAPGRWTHHGRRSHLHLVAPERMGHLDDASLVDGVLLLPVR